MKDKLKWPKDVSICQALDRADLDKASATLYAVCVEHDVHNCTVDSIMDDTLISPQVLAAIQEFIAAYDAWLDS